MKYLVIGSESGDIKEFDTIEEARKFLNELVKFDVKNNIKEEYYIEEIEE